jgi:inhibitor of KinA sporulation pathway (predicted exonuclease)
VKTYQPGILVWGSNDAQVLFQTLKRLDLEDDIHQFRFIDLLKLHKQVYLKKDDIGLLTAYQMYGHEELASQRHDALEDAMMTYQVFNGFNAYLEGKRKPVFQVIR